MISNVNTGSGLSAFQTATTRMAKAEENLAKASVGTLVEGKASDLVSPLVELQQAALGAKAAIRLLEVEKQTSESILDVMA
jgi:hypothetical protein